MKKLIPFSVLLLCASNAFCVTADEFKKLEESANKHPKSPDVNSAERPDNNSADNTILDRTLGIYKCYRPVSDHVN